MRVVKRVAGNVVFYRCKNKRFWVIIVGDGEKIGEKKRKKKRKKITPPNSI